MSPRRSGVAAALILVLAPAAPALAWTDATRVRMLQDALKASPPALAAIFEHHRPALQRGMLDPSRHEGEEVHYQLADGGGGMAAAAVALKSAELRDLVAKRRPLRTFAYEMGVLAHLISDVSFPLNASDADPREALYREAYRRYVETKLPRIPFVLDRSPSPELERDDVRGFVMASARRAAADYGSIGPAFKDDGTPRSPAALDERSVPFGIASLSYSRAVSDIVRLWQHVWESVNGDMSGTPYREDGPPEKVVLPERPRKPKPPAPTPTPGAGPSSRASDPWRLR
jgi:hypothetical protein